MIFLYPLGLLGLIGIPILILIYIIKNRYTEQTVASTYLWTLSERFLKRRNPLSRITGIISLILQLLLVLVLSLCVAHPQIIQPGAADEYCFILDGSGSMHMQSEGKTRFDLAKEEILRVVDEAENGSVFSLILVTDMSETVFELEDDRAAIRERIFALSPIDGSIDYTDAIGLGQQYFDENSSVLTYLVTDRDYTEHKNITVLNVARKENNISLSDVQYTEGEGGYVTVSGILTSYMADRTTDIEVRSNDADAPLGTLTMNLAKDAETPFSISVTPGNFYSLTVSLTGEDALAQDNTVTVYNLESENAYSALLVSDTPFLLRSAIETVSVAHVQVMTTEAYRTMEQTMADEGRRVSGYGLYIYDAFTPTTIPADGSIWFVGPTKSVDNTGFSIQGNVTLDQGGALVLNKSSQSVIKKLTSGVLGEDIFVKKYVKCGLYGNFSTIFSYMGNPLVFTGTNGGGNREVVFAFNLHDTNFPLSPDFLILFHNLLEYSFPAVIEKTDYICGEMAAINVLSGCTSIRVEPPSGEAFYTDTTTAISEFLLSEVGQYRLLVDFSGTTREFYLYSSMPIEERCVVSDAQGAISLQGEAGQEGRDGIYDPMLLLFLFAAILFSAEWMVYCYDKYQFR